MTRVELAAETLVARTVADPDAPDDLLADCGPDGFAWLHDDTGFVTAGIAALVPARDADAALATIEVDDQIGHRGTGPIAVGSLPFRDAADGALVIPRHVFGILADGTRWRTEIGVELDRGTDRAALRRVGRPTVSPGSLRWAGATTREQWRTAVDAALGEIGAGDLSKVVLARTVAVESDRPLDAIWLLRRLAAREPHRYLFATPVIAGASPELLVERDGRVVRSCPLAGSSSSSDPAAVAALAGSDKDRHEHSFVIDAVAAILREHCTDVGVGATETVQLADLAHLATPMRARALDTTPSALGLAMALHPTPAVAGTPRPEALRFLADREPDRGHYAGPVGWVDRRGDGQFAVALRSAEIGGPDRRVARLQAGAGIVAGSAADAEWDEIDAKLRPVLRALGAA